MVVDADVRRRYEVLREEHVLGFAAYTQTDELVAFTHIEVDPAPWSSRGSNRALVLST
jgi:hypothetical protein